MSDLILPTHMAKARKKEKIKVAEEGKTIEELEKNQKKVEEIYGTRESKYLDPDKYTKRCPTICYMPFKSPSGGIENIQLVRLGNNPE